MYYFLSQYPYVLVSFCLTFFLFNISFVANKKKIHPRGPARMLLGSHEHKAYFIRRDNSRPWMSYYWKLIEQKFEWCVSWRVIWFIWAMATACIYLLFNKHVILREWWFVAYISYKINYYDYLSRRYIKTNYNWFRELLAFSQSKLVNTYTCLA